MPKIIENAREKLIQEGRKILINSSYKDLNIRELVKNCGIGIGTFYNYFGNKDELVMDIFKEDWKKILKFIDEMKESDIEFKFKLEKIYTYINEFLKNYMPIFYEIAIAKRDSKGKNKYVGYIYTSMEELIEIEKRKGNITSKLSSYKLAYLIITNLISLSRENYMSFDELYYSLKI
ncbi:TetR/AcrR family transcriptional regulator [Clostridium brassicae]|uniref:TetR/AcrR family transcriptional regulator n=1 Tax=Clostridium brassicae TaxID=2999072 RepID=A0ABT4D7Y6_9CLOT|nr:TetR/AcrR family transcriptional regulator [Clostridium brassicae]MCY6957154.1 TetR/AcrR family transcriptional regulator [Clostridium brassicae]